MNRQSNSLFWLILTFSIVKFLMHMPAIWMEGYGIFRDELYYLACADRLASGYVDHPPLSIWILNAWTSIFGDSWQSIRMVPAIFGGFSMAVLLLWVRHLRGGIIAIIVAAVAFLSAPINLAFGSYYSMNSIDIFFWMLCFYSTTIALERNKMLNWAIVGLAVGLGMMNKISIAWFAIGLVVFLIFTPSRKLLLRKEPYIAGLLALLLFLPFILWNLQHDMAHLTFAKNASAFKYAGISRGDFLTGIILLENPLSVILALPALFFVLNRRYTLAERSSIVIFLVTLLILLIKGQVKSEYMAGAFSAVFAAGALQVETWTKTKITIAYIYVILIFLSGVFLSPLAAPVLSEEKYISFEQQLGISAPNNEGKAEAKLPQFFADMHGWEEMAEKVSEAYLSMPESQRQQTVVWANNYGEAGAIDYFRDKMPLPPVMSPHNNYYLWSLELAERKEFTSYIILGGAEEDHRKFLQQVQKVGTFTCAYCMPYENNMGIFIGSDPKPGIHIRDILIQEQSYN